MLSGLGYEERENVYRHPSRIAVFLGDFIDRGPEQLQVMRIARSMIEAGSARAVMGNHEFNAIAWATRDANDEFLRPHTEKNEAQHRAFLEQIGAGSTAHAEAVAWFKTLPLWLNLDGLRIIHACWHPKSQAALANWVDDRARLTEDGVRAVNQQSSAAYTAAEILLKGPEAQLPGRHFFHDKDGHLRREARLRWWDPNATTFRTAALGIDAPETSLPDDPVPTNFLYGDAVPVLFGHYWLRGTPSILSPLASCLDFSVAKGGVLAAYRWSGETRLQQENLIWVPA